jgi:uncharacterized protein YrzB (UPF0473 family)
MSTNNGEAGQRGPLELKEMLYIQTKDGKELPFEVVGVLEDPDDKKSYAVLLHEAEGEDEEQEFIVTDLDGNLLEDDDLAQEILDDFITFAEEAGDSEGS